MDGRRVVAYLIAKPRGSLAVSAEPISPPTVLKRTKKAIYQLEDMCADIAGPLTCNWRLQPVLRAYVGFRHI